MKSKKAQLDMEILEEPGFWILGGGAMIATIAGYIMSKKAGWIPLPWWQLVLLLLVELVAAAFFASRE